MSSTIEALAEVVRYGRGLDASVRPSQEDLNIAEAVIADGYEKV